MRVNKDWTELNVLHEKDLHVQVYFEAATTALHLIQRSFPVSGVSTGQRCVERLHVKLYIFANRKLPH